MYSKIPYRYLKFPLTLIFLLLFFGLSGISAAGAKKKEIEFDQLTAPFVLSTLSILSPTPDTIRYDGDTALYYDPTPNTWTGVRFTPLYNFELRGIYFGILNQFDNTTDGCSLYVVADDGAGQPDWPSGKLDSFWVAPPVPDRVWIQVDLSSPISFSALEDFHIIYGPAPGGPYPGPGWWNLFDHDSTTTQRSHVSHDDRQTWLTIINADAFIRAGGEYFTVVINELIYRPGEVGRRFKLHEHEWVEIYNVGPDSVDLTGWTISNRDGGTAITLPPWTLPPGCFLTLHQAADSNDNDFEDLDGHYYTGDSTEIFDDDEDECALYSESPDSSTIVDFISWSNKDSYTPGIAHGYAVGRGIWTPGDYYDSQGLGFADCLARYFDGYDRDLPADWWGVSWALYAHNGPLQPENPLQELPRNRSVISDATPTFDWSDFPDADSFQLQVDNDWDFSSPEIDVSGLLVSEYTPTTPLSDDGYFHRVRAFVAGLPTPWAAEWLVVIQTTALKETGLCELPSCPHKYQHKDTELLCIWTDVNGAHTRPGCPETGVYAWDIPHPNATPPKPKDKRVHGTMYCWAAATAMVNAKYGGNLSQDRIAYQNWLTTRPEPEGDLGHDRGVNEGQLTAVLTWALNGATINNIIRPAGGFTFAEIEWWIDQLDCFVAAVPGHALVIDGYAEITTPGGTDIQVVYAQDPWIGPNYPHVFSYVIEGAPRRFFRRHRRNVFYAVWLQPTSGVTARTQEASVTTDSDGDGVMDFDEENRFCSVKNDTDTEDDEVPDKQEIRSYTFHDTDHDGHENDPLNFPDVDGDKLRAECDCDTDNDADFDGGEDIDGDGKSPETGETCVFQSPGEIAIWTDKAVYCPWEHVLLDGQTFHADTVYYYHLIIGSCPDLDSSAALTWHGSVTTDDGGVIHTKDLGTFPIGIHEVVVDVLSDHLYCEDPNWDPWTCFIVIPCDTGCCEFYDHCEMIPEDACTTAGGTWYPSPPYECIGYSCQVCTEDPNDLGERDTLHVETFDCDHIYEAEPGSFDSVRVALYVTHDSNTFFFEPYGWVQDSISAFEIPLKFWHQPEGCADSVILPTFDYWNNSYINPYIPPMNRSMFRHIVDSHTGDTVYNRMLQMVENGKEAWSVYTDIESHSSDGDSGHVFLALVPTSAACQRWWEGNRELLATFTFHVYMSEDCDTTEIGLDSTFWPPTNNLAFTRYDAVNYTPCHFLPVKDTIYTIPRLLCGDCNGDTVVNIADVVCLASYLFIEGPPPDPLCIGDVNCDTLVNIADVVYLVTYLFLEGPPPCPVCCDKAKTEEFPGQKSERE